MSRIQNNVMAANTHRMYSKNNNAVSKSAEKLSSGYRINRAGDDAAGLAISEKMRAQIRGLNMASKNSNDAISLVQTAEGALQEVHTMLQRMNELAVQSSSDTNVEIDRDALQLEFENLQEEIDQIAQTTKFNDTVLLDGAIGGTNGGVAGSGSFKFELGDAAKANSAQGYVAAVASESEITVTAGGTNGTPSAGGKVNTVVAYTDASGNSQSLTVELTYNTAGDKLVAADGTEYGIGGTAFEVAADELSDALAAELNKTALADQFTIASDGTSKITLTAKTAGTAGGSVSAVVTSGHDGATVDTGAVTTPAADAYDTLDLTKLNAATGSTAWDGTDATLADASFTIDGKKFVIGANTVTDAQIAALGDEYTVIKSADTTAAGAGGAAATALSNALGIKVENNAGVLSFKPNAATAGTASKDGLVIQVGAEEGHTLDISIESMNTKGLGVTKAQAKIADRGSASKAISTSRDAINKISTQRAKLGAMQNRLEYKISALDITAENLQAAEGRIRDVDMAKEMTAFTKNNILSQASTAMLAQANASPQNVLQLLG